MPCAERARQPLTYASELHSALSSCIDLAGELVYAKQTLLDY